MNYESNVKSILHGYTNGLSAGNLDAMAVLLDLPNGRNFTRAFSRHQEFVGETIRSISGKEMDLALAMELKSTVIHEESEEYYECWIKEDYSTRRKFGLTVSYDMGWQRRSSGNNYASLSGHGFLIGVHTRRIIACVVFSKKCSICDTRKRKTSTMCQPVTDPSPPSPPPPTSTNYPSPIITPTTSTLPTVCIFSADTLTPPLPSGLVLVDHSKKLQSSLGDSTFDEGTVIDPDYLDTSSTDHLCTRNYDGTSGAMESDGLLLLIHQLQTKYKGAIYLDHVVIDDDTKMKKCLIHPKYCPRDKKHW